MRIYVIILFLMLMQMGYSHGSMEDEDMESDKQILIIKCEGKEYQIKCYNFDIYQVEESICIILKCWVYVRINGSLRSKLVFAISSKENIIAYWQNELLE